MKFLVFLFISILSNLLYTHDRLTFLETGKFQQLCVIKQKGDSICGSSDLNRLLNAGKLILERDNGEKVKLFSQDIKYIVLDSIRLETIVIEEDDIFSEYFIREIDTSGKIKLYEGYTTATKAGFATPYSTGVLTTDVYYAYALKFGKNKIIILKEYKLILFNIDVSSNNKRQLKKIFSKYPNVVQYIESIENLEFDDIPAVIKHINSII